MLNQSQADKGFQSSLHLEHYPLLNITTRLLSEVQSTLPTIVRLEDAWGTIYTELDKAVANINTDDDAKPDVATTTANLTIAVNEWHDVANDAHDFMMNFRSSS